MKTLKKTLCLVLAVVMAVGVFAIPASATDFTDAEKIDHNEAVQVLNGLGILTGYEQADETYVFEPTAPVKRQEAAAIITRIQIGAEAAKGISGTSVSFSDVTATEAWALPYIAFCASRGIISGTPDGKFYPLDSVTGYAFAKMLLVSLGYDPYTEGFTENANWEINVWNVARTANLLVGLEGVDLSKELTRDQAAQMALRALQAGTVTYSGGTQMTIPTENGDIIFHQNATRTIEDPTTEAGWAKTLGKSVHGLDKVTTEATDNFGRPLGYRWAVGNTVLFTAPNPAILILDGATVKADDYKDYTKAETLTVYTDGVSSTGTTLEAAVTGAGANASIEFFGKKDAVDTVVIVKTYADVVTKANAATATAKANIELANDTALVTDDVTGYDAYDVVVYNKYGKDHGSTQYIIANPYKATAVTGIMTGYTNNGVYTINGDNYTLSTTVVNNYSVDVTTSGNLGNNLVYHLDKANKIVYSNAPLTENKVITNYAKVVGANFESTGSTWTSDTNRTYTAQVQVVTTEGFVKVYDLPIGNDLKIGVNGLASNLVASTSMTSASLLDALDDAVYTYTTNDEGTVINLTKIPEMSTDNGQAVVTVKVSGNLTLGTQSGKTLVQSNETVYVFNKGTTFQRTIQGYTALANANVTTPATSQVVVDVKDNVAVVKAAFLGEFATAGAVDTQNLVYVRGTYTAAFVDGNTVYTYDVVATDGTEGTAVGGAGLSAGIYQLMTDGSIGSTAAGYTKQTVGTVIGTAAQIGSNFYDCSTAVIVDVTGKNNTELKADMEVFVIVGNDPTVAETIFIVTA